MSFRIKLFPRRGEQAHSPTCAAIISVAYLVVGSLWVLFSDLVVGEIFKDTAVITQVSMYKGWFFVVVTAYLLNVGIRQAFSQLEQTEIEMRQSKDELESANAELAATEEKMRQQYDALRERTHELTENKERYQSLFDHMFDAFALHEIICNEEDRPINYRFLAVNGSFERITGLKSKDIIGKTVLDIMPALDGSWIEMYGNVVKTGQPIYVTKYLEGAGKYFTVKAYRPKSRQFAVLFLEITEQKKHEEKLEYLAYHDELTGLPNRRMFYSSLAQELQRAKAKNKTLAILLIELTQYMMVNDIAGHKAGEQLLYDIAMRLKGCVRADDMVTRMVGNEFTVLLPNIDSVVEINSIAQRISDSIREPWTYQGQEFFLAANIGVSMYPLDVEDADTLLKRADIAGHRIQEGHEQSDVQFFIPAIEEKIIERNQMESSLRYALERNELVLYYQAQVNVHREIIGMEALLRWNHPTKGLVMPGEFIALAEETGLIIPIGEWVLQAACKQNKEWQLAGYPPVRMAVNISALQFQQKNLVEVISSAVQSLDMNPELLELEITETTAMQNIGYTTHVLKALKKIGIKISLDDFGTGNSSLMYLKRLPIDALKVDRSFVQDLLRDTNDRMIVKTIINLAQNLNLSVIAEGVEEFAQFEFLKEQGCDFFQGYLYSRPIPAEQAGLLLVTGCHKESDLLSGSAEI